MTKHMADSTNSWDIPQNVDMVAGYVNGIYAWDTLAWARWVGKPTRRISVNASNVGDVLDVERYDAFPWEAPGWVVAARARGVADPWVYVSLSNWPATRTEFHLRGVAEPNYWVADYDGIPVIPAGAIAKQYANPTIIPGHPHYDLSVVADDHGGAEGGGGGNVVLSEKRGWVRLAYIASMTRPPESAAVLDAWANQIADDGSNVDNVLISITGSAEALTHMAAVNKAAAAGGAAPDDDSNYALKTHVHTVASSQTGPSQ